MFVLIAADFYAAYSRRALAELLKSRYDTHEAEVKQLVGAAVRRVDGL
jgi:hypothetical protein